MANLNDSARQTYNVWRLWPSRPIHQLLVVTCLVFTFASSVKLYAEDTEAQLKALKSRIAELQSWLKTAQGKRSSEQQTLRTTELAIAKVARKINRITRDIEASQLELRNLKTQEASLNKQLDTQAGYLAQQIRAAYSIGRQHYLKLLLNQEQPERFARVMAYYDIFNRARTEQIEGYHQTLKALAENRSNIETQRNKLLSLRGNLEDKRQALSTEQSKRSIVLKKLEASIKARGGELKKLAQDRKRLEELLQAVEETIANLVLPADTKPIQQYKGRLPWPTSGRIIRSFGSRDSRNNNMRWNGVLIKAPEGRDIKAVHYGHVVFADWLRGFGLLIILDHGNGYMSLYGHNQTLFKTVGDWVSAGEAIASVGNSGGVEQPGLYFEIRKNGKPQNPERWILAKR